MKIIHNIGLSSVSPQEKAEFLAAGVDVSGLGRLQIAEDDPRWEKVELLARKFRMVDMATTNFSAAELDGAKYLGVEPSWHHGYPQPDDDRGYLRATFDLSDYCHVCGIGKRQVAPFRMKKAPAWGRKSILQLNWIFDEYFATPDSWSRIFKPHGIGCRPVLLHKTGLEIDSVVQLEIPKVEGLQLDGFSYETCRSCGQKKYLPITRGFYPKALHPDGTAFKSSEYFGSGASANRQVFVSSEVYREAKSAGLKGVGFKACAS